MPRQDAIRYALSIIGTFFWGLEYMYSDRCQFNYVNIMRFIMTYTLDS
jgi:hypothetical protein